MNIETAQELLDESAQRLGVLGAQLAVFDGSQVIEVATGTARLDTSTPTSTDTRFQIGSTTKVFTAALVMTLVDEGGLDLDEPVSTYLPDFRTPDADATAAITLRHLLSMGAGLDNGPYSDHGRDDACVARYLDAIADLPVLFEPGTAFGYSNAATTVAGRCAEVVADGAWDELLRECVLDPAGLDATRSRLEDLILSPVALGCHPDEGGDLQPVPVWGLPPALKPAGSTLCGTAGDLVRFARLFLDEGRSAAGDQVLSTQAVKTMQSPQVELPATFIADAWGVGPMVKEWTGGRVHGHSGTNSGGSSWVVWAPEQGVAAATIVNVPPRGYPLADAIFAELFPTFGLTPPDRPQPDPGIAVDVQRYVGTYAAHDVRYEVRPASKGDTALEIEMVYDRAGKPPVESPLAPIGPDRFVPTEPAASGGRGWDVAFWGDDGNARATHYLNGVFASARAR
ncbi:MAG TPA: serine hydrolase domain-containing protein [Nitriliruptorales bacterium]